MNEKENQTPLLIEVARERLLAHTSSMHESERIDLWDAVGRVLAEDITALRDQPPFPRSPLDGYAVRSADIQGASAQCPAVLRVIDEVTAGSVSKSAVGAGTAIRIMTGAPIPKGADCIVAQEDTDYGESEVKVFVSLRSFQNYCPKGEDYKAGAVLIPEGKELNHIDIGVIAGTGRNTVSVKRLPRVALFTTGDEVLMPGESWREGKIYDSNLYTAGSRLRSWGMDMLAMKRVADDPKVVADEIRAAAGKADLIVTTGGVSVGKKDIMHDVLRLLGAKRLFWRIAIKPGMPTLCGLYNGTLIVCLSGNPYGAAVNLDLLIRPVLAAMSGKASLKIKAGKATLAGSYPKKSPCTRYVRAYETDGIVRPTSGSNDSGILSSMCGCNCLIEIPAGTEALFDGDMVRVVYL